MAEDRPGLAFGEAIAYHRNKLAMPSKAWTDLWGREHARGFIVAGAATDDLVTGFHEAIGKALTEGRTLADFRKDFDRLVAEHGWTYNGSRGWRTAVIYNTNLSQAYNAGRWEQAKSLDNPVGRYRHNPGDNERPEHKAKHGTTLPLSHSFWSTWWPINAWGCHCQVDILSARAARAAGWTISDDPQPDEMVQRTVNTPQGKMVTHVPKGIDPGFDYNPGEAAFGHKLNERAFAAAGGNSREAWKPLTHGTWENKGRPQMIPLDKPQARPTVKVAQPADVERAVRSVIGGPERIFTSPDGSRTLIDAAVLARHFQDARYLNRTKYLPFLPELLEDPFEIWMAFEQHHATGEVRLRKRIIKALDVGKGESLMLVANTWNSRFTGWTFIPSDRPKQLQTWRYGKLLWGRK